MCLATTPDLGGGTPLTTGERRASGVHEERQRTATEPAPSRGIVGGCMQPFFRDGRPFFRSSVLWAVPKCFQRETAVSMTGRRVAVCGLSCQACCYATESAWKHLVHLPTRCCLAYLLRSLEAAAIEPPGRDRASIDILPDKIGMTVTISIGYCTELSAQINVSCQ